MSLVWATLLSGGFLASLVSPAHAESPSLAGAWNAGPLSEVVTVHSWPEECGPKPKGGNAGAGPYTINIIGDELVFSGARPFRSDECWDRDSAKRVSHSATLSARSWKTRCESPAGDARKAAITTLVRATDDDTLVMSESAKYEAPSPTAGGGACSVTVDRSRIYKRAVATIVASTASATASTTATPSATVAPTASTTTAPPATTTTTAPPKCDSVGEARTLEVRPKKKILRAGEQFDVVARLLDDKGCEVPQKPTFKLADAGVAAGTVTVDAAGRVTAKASAEPGKLSVLVEAGGKSFKVEVEIVTDARWAELLSAGGLEDAGDEPAVVVVSTGTGAVGSTPAKPVAGPAESRRQFAWLAVIGGACTLLLLVALILWRRGGPAKAPSEPVALAPVKPRHGPHTPMPIAPPAFVPPPPPPGVAGPPKAETAVGFADPRAKRCPLCGQAAPFEAEFCPNDGQRLAAPAAPSLGAPAAPAAPAAVAPAAPRGKMCPVCARRYEAEARFCNKDGVALVDVN